MIVNEISLVIQNIISSRINSSVYNSVGHSLSVSIPWRCHQNPFIGALGIQEPVVPGEPLIEG